MSANEGRSSGPPAGEGYEAYVGSIARGAGISSLGQGLGRLLGYIAQVSIARIYGPAQLGFYVVGVTLAQVANVLSQFGMDNGVVRYVAYYRAERDVARVRGTVLQALMVSFALSLAVSGAIFFGAGFLADLLDKPFLATIFRAFSAAVPFLTLMSMALWATQGFQTVKYTTYVQQVVRPVFNLTLIVAFYFLGLESLGAVAAYIVSTAAGCVLALYYLRQVFPKLLDRSTPAKFESRALFSVSGPMTVANITSQLNSWIMIGVLTVFSTVGGVAVYNAAFRTAVFPEVMLVAFNGIFSPMVSGLHRGGRLEELDHLYRDVSRWTFTGAFAIFLLVVLLSKDIMSVFGEEFVSAWSVVLVIAIAQLFNSSIGPTSRILAMTGNQKVVMAATSSETAASFAASLALVPFYGVMGAAIAAAGGIMLNNVMTLAAVRRKLGFWPYNRRYSRPVVAGLLAGGVIVLLKLALPLPAGAISILLLAPAFIIVFTVTLLALGLYPSDRQFLYSFWTAVRTRFVRGDS